MFDVASFSEKQKYIVMGYWGKENGGLFPGCCTWALRLRDEHELELCILSDS
jgi:hypothetical protein